MTLRLVSVMSAIGLSVGTITCPGSASLVHASYQLQITSPASCEAVRSEMLARVAGQPNVWHDPHNNGTYSVVSNAGDLLELARKVGSVHHGGANNSDLMIFDFHTETATGGCQFSGCSESQVFSIGDYSTNLCNLRMMYCDEADGCIPVQGDLGTMVESDVSHSFGAGTDKSACLTVAEHVAV
mmetsp:Transcript_60585/g.161034  ORF Transcript_60585/g.161034 Transcript_60585/m.161034 type:complete len:184 (-) Transcript_60585:114-665(-)